ncbi:hypothetical protein B5X24_HaOG207197 [Helicoverpa armigera]|nr:hypothetical protein B5X24_HaOG207197 [Helicoverpa armigera]
MRKIATYVFLDITTNGYPLACRWSIDIAELCMIAVKRKHIEYGQIEPRTQNTFKMCFYVYRGTYKRKAPNTGLHNENFDEAVHFNEDVCNTIISFLSCLEKPVCMIAHDGFKLHLPLLKVKFGDSLPDDLRCTDSIYAFYDIMTLKNKESTKSYSSKNNKPGVKKYKDIVRKKFYDEDPKESYELFDIYSRVINGDLTQYNAEDQCQMIIQLAIEKRREFVTWVEGNHCRLSEVPLLHDIF